MQNTNLTGARGAALIELSLGGHVKNQAYCDKKQLGASTTFRRMPFDAAGLFNESTTFIYMEAKEGLVCQGLWRYLSGGLRNFDMRSCSIA